VTASQATETDELLTIDELAARTGMTVRTVRFYAGQGLLPQPRRQGRMAYYGPEHRMRLEFVKELQDYGYTLAGIERYLSRIPRRRRRESWRAQSDAGAVGAAAR